MTKKGGLLANFGTQHICICLVASIDTTTCYQSPRPWPFLPASQLQLNRPTSPSTATSTKSFRASFHPHCGLTTKPPENDEETQIRVERAVAMALANRLLGDPSLHTVHDEGDFSEFVTAGDSNSGIVRSDV